MTTFGDAAKQQQEEFNPPDGPITVTIVDTRARKARSGAGAPHAVVTLQPVKGPDVGRLFDHYMNLTGQGLFWAREALIAYGIEPGELDTIDVESEPDLERLAALMKSLRGREADIRIKHWADDRFNVYVDLVRTGRSPDTPQAPPRPPPAEEAAMQRRAEGDRGFGDEAPF